jgi:hypothetical protein
MHSKERMDEAREKAAEFWDKLEEEYDNEGILRTILSYIQERFIRYHLRKSQERDVRET